MTAVLDCDVDGLEASVRTLRRMAAELDSVADEVSGASVPGWSGPAALGQEGRRGGAGDLVRTFVPQVEQVAAGLTRVAASAREEGLVVRRHARLRAEVDLERRRLLALGAPPDPLEAHGWSVRVAALEAEERRHAGLVEEAQRRFDEVQGTVAGMLDRIRAAVPEPVRDLVLLVATADQAVRLARNARAGVSSVGALHRLWRVRGQVAERTRHQMQQRIERFNRSLKLSAPGWVSRLPGAGRALGVAGKAVPFMVLVDAAPDVADGGGYTGWRGATTRGLAGLAIVGVGAALALPPVGAAGLTAAAAYQGWVLGNHLYDNRKAIMGSLRRTWSRGRGLAARLGERAAAGLARLRGARGTPDARGTQATRDARDKRADGPPRVAPGVAPAAGAST